MRISLLMMALTFLLVATVSFAADEVYETHPDSERKDGVPEGKVEGPFEWHSEIFPGTVRQYWVYIPSQYDAEKPTPVFVVQDGLGLANQWKVPIVLDNLIHQGDVPAQIGIFVSPGVVPAPHEDAQPRFNRSFEYDSLGDRYARFLLEEILPEVSKSYNLSKDPNDRAIAGSSSGAICAFNVAWERPNEFRRVLSTVGTYVDLRGGGDFPTLVRKFEPKPIRVFLQDGSNDLNLYAGSWWNANQTMLSALNYAGYDVEHAWGEGGHNNKHASSIIPDALRWLWRDYPEPVKSGVAPQRRTDILIPGEGWKLVSEGHRFTEGPAANAKGEVYFTDVPQGIIHKIALDGTVSIFVEKSGSGINGLMFGPDGKLYGCQNGYQRIVRYDEQGNEEIVIEEVTSNDLIVLADGTGYFTDPQNQTIWRFSSNGEKAEVDQGISRPNGIIASPDQTLITVADTAGRFTYSFQRQSDGSLAYKQTYGHLHLDDEAQSSGADGMTVDTEGRIYVTSSVGLQVLDQLGRVHVILDKPQAGWLSNVTFGGSEFDTLYVTAADKVFRRKVKATGVKLWETPTAPPKPSL
ncbi:MAG: SMP-30/gluconolactonase/LRE family protein [Planctomycetaceae bacterium]|nr:SMP-30/gluconolactonase/LRE family protein [Planctomycetaceae bacterium]